jgi:hypothetical protein
MEVLKMKTYNEILKDIEKAKKALKATEEKQENIIDLIYNARDIKNKIEIKKEHHEQMNKLTENITDLTITIKMLKNNAKRALYIETVPAIIETLKKYNNKPYGEKTRDKISDEIKTATGCRCYIKNSYSDSEINIYPAIYNHEIKIYTKDFKILNNDNKIQVPTAENLKLYYINEYIENIPAAIKAMKSAYKKAVEKQKELEKICNEFNFYAVDGIDRIYKDKYIYEVFRV